ncbi:MAG TPA: glycosyltransferase family 4 protein [Candidatus Acidoferrum sp.]|nr:glycosyltransferase family 4 protein [Candidatus Acidoferrum sp.]
MKTLQAPAVPSHWPALVAGDTSHDEPIGVLWAQYGPYHFARFAALAELAAPTRVHALEIANLSRDYLWSRAQKEFEIATLCPGARTEDLPFKLVFKQARRKLAELGIQVCLLPSYSPRQSVAVLFAAKSLGIRTVMMNESHAGTARATGASAFAKRRLVRLFDAALVGGQPHRQYFASLGMPEERIFTGYDAVDNDYFSQNADAVREMPSDYRARYRLPAHFFLSLGRFVAKKNLATLIWAYRIFLDASSTKQSHLVLVGAGDEEPNLRRVARELHLPVYQKSTVQSPQSSARIVGCAERSGHGSESHKPKIEDPPPGVHFYGFRQIEENPVFYGLADGFVLPSSSEEWGLVVNEAMASGLPVIVSDRAGCAEDLMEPGWPAVPESAASELHQRLGRIKGAICRNGFLFDPASAEGLAGALLALEAVPPMRRAMGQASRRIVARFSCRNFAENALQAVRAALNHADPAPALGRALAPVS